MSDDLVSLKLMLIGATASEQELWRQGAALSTVPVELCACNSRVGIAALARGDVDICVLDGGLPEPEKAAVMAFTRALKPLPVIFHCDVRGDARTEGGTGVLSKPTTPEDARKLVDICTRTKIPTRILIVDDSSTMRSIVRKILTASRFAMDLHEAAAGLDALEQLRTERFGLVFLDYNMPGYNGIETLSEIKKESPDVAVVMMTSTGDDALADRAHASGALAFLKKPFYPADIERVLDRYYGLVAAR